MSLLFFGILLMLLGVVAQNAVRSTFAKYSQQRPSRGLTGEQTAREILDSYGLHEVRIEETSWGQLSDHYDPAKQVLRLSREVGPVSSIAAVGIAAHEAGHAIQHAEAYPPLMMRSSLAPTIALGIRLAPWIFLGGSLLGLTGLRQVGIPLAALGILLYLSVTLMSLITLPVEFDASYRAKKFLYHHQIVDRQEMQGVNAVLDAAAWTYVVSALSAIVNLLLRRR